MRKQRIKEIAEGDDFSEEESIELAVMGPASNIVMIRQSMNNQPEPDPPRFNYQP